MSFLFNMLEKNNSNLHTKFGRHITSNNIFKIYLNFNITELPLTSQL